MLVPEPVKVNPCLGPGTVRGQGFILTLNTTFQAKLYFVRFSCICWVQGSISKVSLIQDNEYSKWSKEANHVLLCQYIGLV